MMRQTVTIASRPLPDARQRLRDRIYDAIRDLVERGKLQPGQRLTETHLAARFGVSRTPVREALFQLAREGLLEPLERGYGLLEMPMSGVLARLDVKRLLDPVMTVYVVETASPAQIEQLCQLARDGATALGSEASPFALASGLHRLQKDLAIACSNPVLARCCVAAEDDFLAARPLLLRGEKGRAITADYLDGLMTSLRARCPETAESGAHNYIARLVDWCRESDTLPG